MFQYVLTGIELFELYQHSNKGIYNIVFVVYIITMNFVKKLTFNYIGTAFQK